MSDSPTSAARSLWQLAYPVIGLNLLGVTSLFVDTIMCGQLEDAETVLTALGFAGQIQFLFLVAMMGLTVGTVSLVSRAFGMGQGDRVRHIFLQSSQFTFFLGAAMGLLGALVSAPLIRLLGASPEVVEAAMQYLLPLFGGLLFSYLSLLYAGLLRGVGNTRLPLRVALFSNVLNVVLNYGLILGNFGLPALGLAGAAYGTVISQATGVVLLIGLLGRPGGPVGNLSFRPERFDGEVVRDLISIGGPSALDMSIINISLLAIVGMLGHGDDIAVAAHGLGLRVQALVFVPGVSVTQATAALVGQSLGASDEQGARRTLRASIGLCVGIMSGLGLLVVLLARPIVSLFGVDGGSELMELSLLWLRVLSLGMPLLGLHLAFNGLLQGAGATGTGLRINFATTFLFQIPASWLLGIGLGLGPLGIWVGFPLSYILKVALDFLAYRQGGWVRLGLHA